MARGTSHFLPPRLRIKTVTEFATEAPRPLTPKNVEQNYVGGYRFKTDQVQVPEFSRAIRSVGKFELHGEDPDVAYVGTGFLVSSQGHLMTAYHVIRKIDPQSAEYDPAMLAQSTFILNGTAYSLAEAKIIRKDTFQDVAVLEIPALAGKPFLTIVPPPPPAEANVGNLVVAGIGFPNYTETPVLSVGKIQEHQMAIENFSNQNLATSVLNGGGMSGGPLLNRQGQVIGVHQHGAAREYGQSYGWLEYGSYASAIPTGFETLEFNPQAGSAPK